MKVVAFLPEMPLKLNFNTWQKLIIGLKLYPLTLKPKCNPSEFVFYSQVD